MIIGIDMGGTHCDGVLIDQHKVQKKEKQLTDESNIKNAVLSLLKSLLENQNKSKIEKIILSTTIVTNTLSKNQQLNAGLFLIPGLGAPFQKILDQVSNSYVSQNGYVDHRGVEVARVSNDEYESAYEFFKEKKINHIAVVSKFSTRNNIQEKKAEDFFSSKGMKVYKGSDFSGKLNFPRRCITAYLTASVAEIYEKMINDIKEGIREIGVNAPIYILKADAGAVTLEESLNFPIESVLSGPAASIMGALYSKDIPQTGDSMVLDIGGITTDLGFFIDGEPILEPLGIQLKSMKSLVRALKVFPLAIGGDTLFDFDNMGKVKLDNKRLGVAYTFGGPKATLTDVFLSLDHDDKKALEGLKKEITQNFEFSLRNIQEATSDFLVNEIKQRINEINSEPIYTVKDFFHRKKFQPAKLILIGGAAPYFKNVIQKALNIEVIVPDHFEICNAIGSALSQVTAEVNLFANTADGTLSIPEMGYFEKVPRSFHEKNAKELALEKLSELAKKRGLSGKIDYEITEYSSFNMVRGFSTNGKNIRIKAQVKPGLSEDY